MALARAVAKLFIETLGSMIAGFVDVLVWDHREAMD